MSERSKVPILHALAAWAPYFHNGTAATLDDVGLSPDTEAPMIEIHQAKADLVAFLKAL
jgi:cytochrome c peroxidase